MNFMHNLLIVIISYCTTELVVIHCWLSFSIPPECGDSLGIEQLELSISSSPADNVGVFAILQELVQKLPQLNLSCRIIIISDCSLYANSVRYNFQYPFSI